MSKVEQFKIVLDKKVPIYFPGDYVTGHLKIETSKKLKLDGIKCNYNGSALVKWKEKVPAGRTRRTVIYSSKENYINGNLLFLSKDEGKDLFLEPGVYTYPFRFQLPKDIPTSFEHELGRIRYVVNGTIQIPWAFDLHTKKSFTVINKLDLNQTPGLRKAYGVSSEKILCCGPCKSDPILADFSIDKAGYVCGELVPFKATINNQSNREISDIRVKILQKIKFNATTKTRLAQEIVASANVPKKVGAKTSDTWTRFSIAIPPVCSSSEGECSIIQIKYYIVFSFDAPGAPLSSELSIPITIGTIPLRSDNDASLSIEHHGSASSLDFLPSYEESVFGLYRNQELNQDENATGNAEIVESDQNTFVPMYPIFKEFSTLNKGDNNK